jgi:hypothetical protein
MKRLKLVSTLRAPRYKHLRFWLIASLLISNGASLAYARRCDRTPFRVAVDIGHTRAQPGVISARGKEEYGFNRRYALELLEMQKKSLACRYFCLRESAKLSG